MSTLHDFESALSSRALSTLTEMVRDRPDMTVNDLREILSDHPQLRSVTLSELFPSSPSSSKASKRRGSKPSGKRSWNVRTAKGRAALDDAILNAIAELGGESVSASDIRSQIGGTPHQVRTSLNRFIEAGTLTFTGQARGTRYSLA